MDPVLMLQNQSPALWPQKPTNCRGEKLGIRNQQYRPAISIVLVISENLENLENLAAKRRSTPTTCVRTHALCVMFP